MINELLTIVDMGDGGIDHMIGDFATWWMWPMMLAFIVVTIFLISWTYQDAAKRGDNAAFWSLIVFLTMGFGVFIYILVRTPGKVSNKSQEIFTVPSKQQQQTPMETFYCTACGVPLTAEDKFCYSCGKTTT
ncbi:MAG: hypothetical protein ACTSRU_10110 [Candidatus Hodarchaeales archaeon]